MLDVGLRHDFNKHGTLMREQTATIFWTFAGLIAISATTLAVAKSGRNSADYVFTHFESNSGWPEG